MYEVTKKDSLYLSNMLEAAKKINKYSEKFADADGLYEDDITFDAIMMNFIVIGEMVTKLSNTFIRATQNKIDWLKIKNFRNLVAHNYFGIDAEEVWQIIHGSLKNLRIFIVNVLQK